MRRILSLFLLTLLGVTAGFAATETFDFKFETMGEEGWASSYAEHTVEGTIADVVFASANKQASTITDVPVTKGGNVTATLKNINSYKITGVKFVCKQWDSKTQTITLNVSSDGENFTATQTTSDNFTLEATGLDTKAVRFTFSSTSNQVGISSLEITYETVPQGGDQPGLKKPTILINEEAPAASYSTEDLPLTLSITSGNGVTSAPVFVYNLTGSLDYNSSVSAWFSLGLVQENPGCPYPLVVGQNTIHVWEIVNGERSPEATVTITLTEPVGNLTALKQVWALTDGDEFTFGAKTAVLGKDKNSRNLYIVDLNNAGGLMVDGGANNAWGDDYVFGKAIGSGWSGKKAIYNGQPEATNTQNFAIDGTAEVQPLSIDATDVTAENYGRYAVIENATVAAGGAIEGYTLYNQLGIDMTSVEAGLYNVYGIIGLYSQNLQFWPMRYEPIEDPTFVAAPTITVTPQFGVGANEAIFIDCATEGATIYYGIEKDGETLIEIEEYAGPIDLSQYEAGEYTVEAYAVNGDYESEVASATFTITEPAEAVEYKLVTSTDDLQGGDYVIFASGRHAAGLGASGDGINNGFTFDGDKVEVETEDILVLSIVPANTEGEFAIMHGEKYMNLGSGAAPTFVNDPHAWPIEIDEDGNATIHGATTSSTSRALIYRSDSDIFKNYALSNVENGNGYELVQIFKKVEQQEEGLTLAEVLALEEPADVNIISKLTVVAHNADYTFATDTEGNWIRLDLEEILDETQVINNVKGAYNANPLSPALAVEDFSLLEEQDDNNYIVNIDLKEQFDIPVPAQVVKVTGYYQKGGTLRGWAELLGQSLILSNDLTGFAGEPFDDMVDTEGTTVIVGALYENVPVAIEYFEPMSDEMLAPRRAAEYKFQNLNGQMIDDALPVPSEVPTAIETVESTKGVKSVKYVNAMGQMSDRAFDGMNIVVTTYNDGTTSTVKVVK